MLQGFLQTKTNIWNTKVSDLTVGDSVKLQIAAPILVMTGVMLAGGMIGAVNKLTGKFRKSDSTVTETE